MALGRVLASSALLLAALTLNPSSARAQDPVVLQGDDRADFRSTQWIESHLKIKRSGQLEGKIILWNEDTDGYCAEAVFLLADASGRQITYFTGGGCIRRVYGRSATEHTIHKQIDLHSSLDPASFEGARVIRIKVIPDDKVEVTPEMVASLFQ